MFLPAIVTKPALLPFFTSLTDSSGGIEFDFWYVITHEVVCLDCVGTCTSGTVDFGIDAGFSCSLDRNGTIFPISLDMVRDIVLIWLDWDGVRGGKLVAELVSIIVFDGIKVPIREFVA